MSNLYHITETQIPKDINIECFKMLTSMHTDCYTFDADIPCSYTSNTSSYTKQNKFNLHHKDKPVVREKIVIDSENHTKHINTLYGMQLVTSTGTYSYHWVLKN
jgi:hypothetical protein